MKEGKKRMIANYPTISVAWQILDIYPNPDLPQDKSLSKYKIENILWTQIYRSQLLQLLIVYGTEIYFFLKLLQPSLNQVQNIV